MNVSLASGYTVIYRNQFPPLCSERAEYLPLRAAVDITFSIVPYSQKPLVNVTFETSSPSKHHTRYRMN